MSLIKTLAVASLANVLVFVVPAQALEPTCAGFPLDVDMNLGELPSPGNVSEVIGGTPGDDIIQAYGGDDIVCGFNGYDQIYGGRGNDILYGGDSFDVDDTFNVVYGGTGDDVLVGGSVDLPNWLYGQGGDDYFIAYGSILEGGSGNDVLDNSPRIVGSSMKGGGNKDIMKGGSAVDIMIGGPGLDEMFGNGGDDQMFGGTGADQMNGGQGNDVMSGGAANDFMQGEAGDDNISGNSGNDNIDGGSEVSGDTCNGGNNTTMDVQTNCEFSSGFPSPSIVPTGSPQVDNRVPLTDTEIMLINNCNLSVEECLGTRGAGR